MNHPNELLPTGPGLGMSDREIRPRYRLTGRRHGLRLPLPSPEASGELGRLKEKPRRDESPAPESRDWSRKGLPAHDPGSKHSGPPASRAHGCDPAQKVPLWQFAPEVEPRPGHAAPPVASVLSNEPTRFDATEPPPVHP